MTWLMVSTPVRRDNTPTMMAAVAARMAPKAAMPAIHAGTVLLLAAGDEVVETRVLTAVTVVRTIEVLANGAGVGVTGVGASAETELAALASAPCVSHPAICAVSQDDAEARSPARRRAGLVAGCQDRPMTDPYAGFEALATEVDGVVTKHPLRRAKRRWKYQFAFGGPGRRSGVWNIKATANGDVYVN